MDFIRINDAKLKVLLTQGELEQYGIRITDGDCEGGRIKEALKSIFDEAGAKAGFTVGKDRALVQIYPTEGGAEMFVTKLSALGERERRAINDSPLPVSREAGRVFGFDSLELLADAARAMGQTDCRSTLYYSNEGRYYISITERGIGKLLRCEILGEYGKEAELPLDVPGEGGKLVLKENALQALARL